MALPGLPRGVEEDLPAVGGSRSNVLCSGVFLHVGHELHVDAPILSTAVGGAVRRSFLIFAQSRHVDLVRGHVVLAGKILNSRRSTHLAKFVVVLCAANRVGSTNQLDYVSLGVRNVISELIESLFGFLAEYGTVERKVHRGLCHGTIVIEVGYGVGQCINFARSLSGRLVRLVGCLTSSECLLIDGSDPVVYALNSLLRAGIDVADITSVFRSQVVEFVCFVDYWRSFVAHILLGGASGVEDHGGAGHKD